MAWSTILKIAGGVAASAGGDAAKGAIVDWRDELRACESLKILFHQAILDSEGHIQKEREQYETAGISFTLTRLKLDDLVKHPVYHVEVINLALPGDNPSRVRHFGYNSANHQLWLAKPTDPHILRAPSGWPVVCSGKMKSIWEIDKETSKAGTSWFQRPLSRGEKALLGIPIMWGASGLIMGASRMNDINATQKITVLLHQHCVQGEYYISPERHQVDVDDFSFWLTPLRTAMSDQTVLYHLVVLNRRLPSHPKRAVAFIYSLATRKLQWM